ncbi:MAG: 2Fe-2S iron-sulfur cluster-binding protein [Pseudomonadales bacterium]
MIDLNVNGVRHSVDVASDTPLLWVLREQLSSGTKFGCSIAQCSACTIPSEQTADCVPASRQFAAAAVSKSEPSRARPAAVASVTAWIEYRFPVRLLLQSGQLMSAAALPSEQSHPGRRVSTPP